MYVFVPPDGQGWGLTYEGLEAGSRVRNTGEFVRVDEGVSVLDCAARSVVRFAL
ncbi:hypothetical protein AB0I51_18020 [Streptomyces sp. NPDC050549]|uniref:hypothetical protein n=1 Tax=Streptomyces sp. NPDC050549 TaxID=3155406 RepID=UPI003444CA72